LFRSRSTDHQEWFDLLCLQKWICRRGLQRSHSLLPIITPLKPQYSALDKFGDDHPLFYPLTQMFFTMTPADFLTLRSIAFAWSTEELGANLLVVNPKMQNNLPSKVGIRVRGGVTKLNIRKSYTIDLEYAKPGQNISGIRKFGLRSLPFDPSFIRDKAVHDFQYYIGVKRVRSAYVQLYINQIFVGLYMVQEQFNDDFLTSRFGENSGSLVKGEAMAFLDFKGTDRHVYADCKDIYGNSCYEPKTARAQTFVDLVSLITTLNLDEKDRIEKLPKWLDMDDLLRNLAIEMAIGQTDGVENGKNYYLYKPTNKPFQLILHDFDMVMGFKSFNLTSHHTIWNFNRANARPLYGNTLPVKQWHDSMKAVWTAFLTQFDFSSNTIWKQRITGWQQLLSKFVRMDKWHSVDYGWTFNEFNQNSINGGFSRIGVNGTTPCSMRTCLWVEGVGVHVGHQRQQILLHLND